MLTHGIPRLHLYPRPPTQFYPRPPVQIARFPRMTAIAGFNCSNGVVIAADSEESYGLDAKVYSHKLFPFERPTWRLCVAGAGSAYLIDYAKDQIVKEIESGANSPDDFERALRTVLEGLYKNEFKHFPVNERRELTIQLLVSAQFISDLDN